MVDRETLAAIAAWLGENLHAAFDLMPAAEVHAGSINRSA
jgi:hypothetical protein